MGQAGVERVENSPKETAILNSGAQESAQNRPRDRLIAQIAEALRGLTDEHLRGALRGLQRLAQDERQTVTLKLRRADDDA